MKDLLCFKRSWFQTTTEPFWNLRSSRKSGQKVVPLPAGEIATIMDLFGKKFVARFQILRNDLDCRNWSGIGFRKSGRIRSGLDHQLRIDVASLVTFWKLLRMVEKKQPVRLVFSPYCQQLLNRSRKLVRSWINFLTGPKIWMGPGSTFWMGPKIWMGPGSTFWQVLKFGWVLVGQNLDFLANPGIWSNPEKVGFAVLAFFGKLV